MADRFVQANAEVRNRRDRDAERIMASRPARVCICRTEAGCTWLSPSCHVHGELSYSDGVTETFTQRMIQLGNPHG